MQVRIAIVLSTHVHLTEEPSIAQPIRVCPVNKKVFVLIALLNQAGMGKVMVRYMLVGTLYRQCDQYTRCERFARFRMISNQEVILDKTTGHFQLSALVSAGVNKIGCVNRLPDGSSQQNGWAWRFRARALRESRNYHRPERSSR